MTYENIPWNYLNCTLKHKCENRELRGIEKAAFRLHCSARQLQRVLNEYEKEGVVVKIGKDAYKLID